MLRETACRLYMSDPRWPGTPAGLPIFAWRRAVAGLKLGRGYNTDRRSRKESALSLRLHIADTIRPIRRRLTPRHFKESYVNDVLALHAEPIYVEIGVRNGDSFRLAKAPTKIGVDPSPGAAMYPMRPGEQLFECTSDVFFRKIARRVLAPGSVTVALVDGLHEFKQVVRDIHGLEPYMAPKGLMVLDDMNPTSRDRGSENPTGRAWNGDVWKVGAYLQAQRADLQFVTVDADNGVGLITGFSAQFTDTSQAALQKYKDLQYDDLMADRVKTLQLVRPARTTDLLPFISS